MKFLITGDWHITDKTPKRRTDNYFKTLNNKIDFILKTALDYKVEAILQPGDFFDSHKANDFLKQHFIQKLKKVGIRIITIFGQHDLRFHSSNIDNTPLRVLEKSGCIDILVKKVTPITYVFEQTHHTVIHGANWNEDIPKIANKNDIDVLLTHRMIIKDEKLWHDQEEFTRAKGLLKRNKFDLIVSGDNHQSFMQVENEKILVNCGSLMRSTIAQTEHQPKICIYDTQTKQIGTIHIPIKPFAEVFNLEHIEEEKERNEEMGKFIESLKEGIEFSGMDFAKNVKTYIDKNNIQEGTINILDEILGGLKDEPDSKRIRRAR